MLLAVPEITRAQNVGKVLKQSVGILCMVVYVQSTGILDQRCLYQHPDELRRTVNSRKITIISVKYVPIYHV